MSDVSVVSVVNVVRKALEIRYSVVKNRGKIIL